MLRKPMNRGELQAFLRLQLGLSQTAASQALLELISMGVVVDSGERVAGETDWTKAIRWRVPFLSDGPGAPPHEAQLRQNSLA